MTFVPNALNGEAIDISLEKSEKLYNIARLNEIIKKSPERIPSFCPYNSLCGGCTFSHLSYANSLKYKKEIISDLLKQNNLSFSSLEIIPSSPVLGYRNKVSLKVEEGEFGYYEEQSHRFIPIKNCYLLSPSIESLLKDFSMFHFQNGELIIQMNSKGDMRLNIKTQDKISILEEQKGNIRYRYSFHSFFQVNAYFSEKIKEDVMNCVNYKDKVYDLYCGVGFFSLLLTLKVKIVIGIEKNKEAILMALENVQLNYIENEDVNINKLENILREKYHLKITDM